MCFFVLMSHPSHTSSADRPYLMTITNYDDSHYSHLLMLLFTLTGVRLSFSCGLFIPQTIMDMESYVASVVQWLASLRLEQRFVGSNPAEGKNIQGRKHAFLSRGSKAGGLIS